MKTIRKNKCYVRNADIVFYFYVLEMKNKKCYGIYLSEFSNCFVYYNTYTVSLVFKYSKTIPEGIQQRLNDPFLEIDFKRWREL